MSSPVSLINGNHSKINKAGSTNVFGNKGPNLTDSKTGVVAGNALKPSSGNGSPLVGRVDLNPGGRTWSQFGQLVVSYITLGLVSAPPAPIPRVSSEQLAPVNPAIPGSVGLPAEEKPTTPSNLSSPSTFTSRALDAIKSFFTAIYNMLFGVRN
jgi:hypothetical protein